jgi:hypothetical protein
VTIVEALAERAARGELTPSEEQSALAILLRDLVSRDGPSGAVTRSQDDVVTRKTDAPPSRVGGGGPP